jgi:two-component system chemotaxis sensor kinase CheA
MLSDTEIMAQVLAAFQEEQAEHRQAAGDLLLELERNPDHPQRQALLDQLFREAHSLKGGARAAGQLEIEQLAHRIEDLFSAVRQGRRQLTPDVCDPIYAALETIGAMASQVAAGQPVDSSLYQPLLARLAGVLDDTAANHRPAARRQNGTAPAVAHRKRQPAVVPAPPPTPVADRSRGAGNGQASSDTQHSGNVEVAWEGSSATVRLPTAVLDSLLNDAGELMTCTVGVQEQLRVARELAELPARWRRIWRQAQPSLGRLASRAPVLQPTVHYLDGRHELRPLAGNENSSHDMAMLTDALTQANALIADLEQRLARQVHQVATQYARLHAVSDQLHTQIRRTRMLPLASLFSPLRLQTREMARAAGKQVVLELDDGGAEVDRQVLERLGEVLTHLLRNAVDHGIEPAETRVARGKLAEGRIRLRAEVSGDRLILTIEDDGAGLDQQAIRQRALDGGHMDSADLARRSEAELTDLIFLPGFSTKPTVTQLSGRGVGLDIVRSRVERMQGRVVARSAAGAGCAFTLTLPLWLTSSNGLLLRTGKASYVLPLDSVQRILPVTARDIRTLEGRAGLVVDGRPLMVVALADVLNGTASAIGDGNRAAWHGLLIGSGDRQVVCLVDEVLGEQEVVVHRLPAPLQQVPCIAGATILADGTVVPILDAVDVLRAALGIRHSVQIAAEVARPARRSRILVVDDSITTRTLEKNILEAAGYQVRLATDGAEALELLEQLAGGGGCDLLLSDVDMPRLNGFELAARIRADKRFQHLPIVLVTSLDTAEDRKRGIAAGADAYIVKSQFEQQTLLDTIARLV